MSSLDRSISDLLQHNKEGSFSTHANRAAQLKQIGKDLKDAGYKLQNIRNMKQKHVRTLVAKWQERGLSAGTIKNRMSALRWTATKINNPQIVERSNRAYNIEDRQYVKNDINIAKRLDKSALEKITNDNVKMSLRLQEAFGLRREEAMKIQPNIADKGDKLELKSSWCKGGRERSIPIRTEEQRQLLDEAKEFVNSRGDRSLIPRDLSYAQQLKAYEYQTEKAGIDRNHGLRHQYAQDRYFELTGRECPKNGGLTFRQLDSVQRVQDYEARLQISNELGHGREAITAVYLGR